jgi:hypothetical protein
MEKDKFDNKMVEIESKSFEISMLMSGFVFEILKNFEEFKSELYCELPYYDLASGYKTVVAEFIYLDEESGVLLITADGIKTPVMWDELNIAAKEIVIAELHHKYKAVKLYNNLTIKEEMH